MAGSDESRHEAARAEARETLGDLIGARLEERRRAVARIFDEIDGPEGRALARAKAALDTGPAGMIARRYEEADERGLLRMLDHLDRRRKSAAKSPDSHQEGLEIDRPGTLGTLPNEPNLGRAGVVPTRVESAIVNGTGVGTTPATRQDGRETGWPCHLGKVPNEPKGREAEGVTTSVASEGAEASGGRDDPGHPG